MAGKNATGTFHEGLTDLYPEIAKLALLPDADQRFVQSLMQQIQQFVTRSAQATLGPRPQGQMGGGAPMMGGQVPGGALAPPGPPPGGPPPGGMGGGMMGLNPGLSSNPNELQRLLTAGNTPG